MRESHVTITIKSRYHKCMNQVFMDTVDEVSPTGAAITRKFMVMVRERHKLG
jgi:hypothetical protein